MNPEKFNPGDPRYKKVEDLPREIQDRYVNTEDGFVLKSAAERYESAKIEANNAFVQQENRETRQEEKRERIDEKRAQADQIKDGIFSFLPSQRRRLQGLERVLAMLSSDLENINVGKLTKDDFILEALTEVFRQGDKTSSREDIQILQDREYYRSMVDNYIDRQIDLMRIEAFAHQAKKLKSVGHEGFLTFTSSREAFGQSILESAQRGIHTEEIIEGYLDGNFVRFIHTRNDYERDYNYLNSGKDAKKWYREHYDARIAGTNTDSVNTEIAKELFNEYNGISVDVKKLDLELEKERGKLHYYKLPADIDVRIAKLANKVSTEKTQPEKERRKKDIENTIKSGERNALGAATKIRDQIGKDIQKRLIESLLPRTGKSKEILDDPVFSLDRDIESLLGWVMNYPGSFEISSLPSSALEVIKYFYGDDISQLKTVDQIQKGYTSVFDKIGRNGPAERFVTRSQLWKYSLSGV